MWNRCMKDGVVRSGRQVCYGKTSISQDANLCEDQDPGAVPGY